MPAANLRRAFFLYQATASVVFFQAIFFVYYMEVVGLSLPTILFLQSYNVALRALLEVPSGVLADRWSRRGCLVTSALAIGGGSAVLLVVPSLAAVVVVETALATAHALRSGADSALLHDGMVAAGAGAHYPEAESRARAVGAVSSGVTALLGGFLAEWDLSLPYVVTIVAVGIGAVVATRLPEAPHRSLVERGRTGPALAFAAARPALWWAISLAALAVVASHVYYYFQQPYLELIGMPLWVFGSVFAATKLVTATVAMTAHRVDARLGARGTAAVMTAVPVVGVGAMALITSPVGAMVILTRGLLDGLWEPLVNVYMNRLVPTHLRATLLSVQNLVARLSLAGALAVLGIAGRVYGLRPTLGLAAAATLVGGLVLVSTAHVVARAPRLADGPPCDS